MIKENVIIKKDSPENWAKAKNFVPKENEIIMYIQTHIPLQEVQELQGKQDK